MPEANLKQKAKNIKINNLDDLNFNSFKKLKCLLDLMNKDISDKPNEILSINKKELNTTSFILLLIKDINKYTTNNNNNSNIDLIKLSQMILL